MAPFMAKRSIMSKFRKTHEVSYRPEDEISDTPHTCTLLECSTYKMHKDGEIDLLR